MKERSTLVSEIDQSLDSRSIPAFRSALRLDVHRNDGFLSRDHYSVEGNLLAFPPPRPTIFLSNPPDTHSLDSGLLLRVRLCF